MKNLIKLFSILIFLEGYSVAKASENLEEQLSERKINLSLRDYLSQTDNPRLLMPCGHEPQISDYYNKGFSGTNEVHKHIGWYTVDIDPILKPDYIASIDDKECQDYIFQPQTWNLIYLENISKGHLTHDFFTKAYESLKPGGSIIFDSSFLKKSHTTYCKYEDGTVAYYTLLDSFTDRMIVDGKIYILPCLRYFEETIKSEPPTTTGNNLFVGSPKIFLSITEAEDYLKEYFHKVIGFNEVHLFADSVYDDKWMKETTQHIYNEHISNSQQNSLSQNFEKAEVERVKGLLISGPNGEFYKEFPFNYRVYQRILRDMEPSLWDAQKPDTFIIARKKMV